MDNQNTAFYAHSRPNQPIEQWERLDVHLNNVARHAADFGDTFGAGELARLAGAWHDLGKASDAFQQRVLRVRGDEAMEDQAAGRFDHSTAGTQHAAQVLPKQLGLLLAYMIAGHHGHLPDWITPGSESGLEARLRKDVEHVRNSFLKARDEQSQSLASGRAGNTLGELSEALTGVEQVARATSQPVRVVMEATTNSRAVQQLLEQWGEAAGIDLTTDVLDPRKLRLIAESTAKCDRLDTDLLLELAASNLRLPTCHMVDDATFALREHLRGRADLVRVQTMIKNRVHALLHRRGILKPARMDLFTQRGRQFLQQAELDEAGRHMLTRYLQVFDQLRQTLNESERQLKQLSRSEDWRESTEILQSMPGMGLITPLTLLAELGDIHRFRSRSAVSNYGSLVPVVRSSNGWTYHGKLASGGNRHLRHVMAAAWRAYGQVPAYESIVNRITARSGKNVAIVAVARRMLEDAWTMLKRREPFRYSGSSDPTRASSEQAVPPVA